MEYFLLVTYPIPHAMTQGKMFFPLIVLFGIHPHEPNQINCLYYLQGFRENIDAYLEDLKFITASSPPPPPPITAACLQPPCSFQ